MKTNKMDNETIDQVVERIANKRSLQARGVYHCTALCAEAITVILLSCISEGVFHYQKDREIENEWQLIGRGLDVVSTQLSEHAWERYFKLTDISRALGKAVYPMFQFGA